MHKQKTDSKTYCAEKNASRLYDKRHAASRKSERKGSPPAVKARAYNAYTNNESNNVCAHHNVDGTANHGCVIKQQLQCQRGSTKFQKCRGGSKNTIFSPILQNVLHWCPCFCCCQAHTRRIISKIGGTEDDEELLAQLCFRCSDKGLKTSTDKCNATRRKGSTAAAATSKQKLRHESSKRKTRASSRHTLGIGGEERTPSAHADTAKEKDMSRKHKTKSKYDGSTMVVDKTEKKGNLTSRHDSGKLYETDAA